MRLVSRRNAARMDRIDRQSVGKSDLICNALVNVSHSTAARGQRRIARWRAVSAVLLVFDSGSVRSASLSRFLLTVGISLTCRFQVAPVSYLSLPLLQRAPTRSPLIHHPCATLCRRSSYRCHATSTCGGAVDRTNQLSKRGEGQRRVTRR
jgi:hypothetical protein